MSEASPIVDAVFYSFIAGIIADRIYLEVKKWYNSHKKLQEEKSK